MLHPLVTFTSTSVICCWVLVPGPRIKSEASLAGHPAPGSDCSGHNVCSCCSGLRGLFWPRINGSHLPAYSDTSFTADKGGLKRRSFEQVFFFFFFFACSTVQYFSNKTDLNRSAFKSCSCLLFNKLPTITLNFEHMQKGPSAWRSLLEKKKKERKEKEKLIAFTATLNWFLKSTICWPH